MLKFFKKKSSKLSSIQLAFIIILVFSVVGLLCSFILTQDKFMILENANTKLDCSINSVIDCGPVLRSEQASVFGFTNTIIGLSMFASLITIAVVGLSGVQLKKWFLFCLQLGTGLGFIFAYWLLLQSAFVIGAFCPYCLATTFSVTLIFAATTHINMLGDNLYLRKDIAKKIKKWAEDGWDRYFWLGWITVIVAIVLIHLRGYF